MGHDMFIVYLVQIREPYRDFRRYPPDYRGSYEGDKRHHPAHTTAAVNIALPNCEKEESLEYLDQYSCYPPPVVMVLLSLSQVT